MELFLWIFIFSIYFKNVFIYLDYVLFYLINYN